MNVGSRSATHEATVRLIKELGLSEVRPLRLAWIDYRASDPASGVQIPKRAYSRRLRSVFVAKVLEVEIPFFSDSVDAGVHIVSMPTDEDVNAVVPMLLGKGQIET